MENSPLKVLAIDDNQDNLVTLKALIREAFPNAVVITAQSGQKGLDLAAAENPDVILLDIVMPGMDGFEVCKNLKANHILCDIPVVFITAIKGDKEGRIRALESGAEAFLAKPIDESELTAQIRAMAKIKNANSRKHAEKDRLAALVSEQTIALQETNIATLNLLEELQRENESRRRSEAALTISETRYRRLFETAKDGILILDGETGKIMDVNPFLIKMLGYSHEEFIEKEVWEIGLFRDIIPNHDKFLELQQKEYVRYEDLPLETADGRRIEVEFISNVYTVDRQKVIQCNIRDISARKQAEKQVKLLSRAVEQSPVSIVITNKEGNIEYANPKFREITGYTTNELNSNNPRILQSGEHSKDFYADLWDTILSGREWHGEFHNKKKNGDSYWEDAIISSIVDHDGRISWFVGVKLDITEKRNMMTDLVAAKEKAEESDRLKSAFLANMSHEIRTPMNGILGFAGLLKEPGLSGEEQQKYIRIIEKSGARMLNIINDIVSISKIESGQMDVAISETNVNDQLEFLYTFFRPETQQKGILLFCQKSLPASEVIINTDREKLYAILTNIIKNAIKFSDRGTIDFGYTLQPAGSAGSAMLEFYVKDTGIGIPKSRQEAIFDRFVQADIGDRRAFQGAGLGLSIAKAYVEMLGGTIRVDSEEGKGSCFYFTIPYRRNIIENKPTLNPVADPVLEKLMKKLKILVAEDDETSENLMAINIKMFGREILSAATGAEAVETCRANPDIDLVLMDLKMPVLDGYEATRQIRQFNTGVVIVAQTAYALSGDRVKAIDAGCNEYLAKPINKDDLMNLINRFFQPVDLSK